MRNKNLKLYSIESIVTEHSGKYASTDLLQVIINSYSKTICVTEYVQSAISQESFGRKQYENASVSNVVQNCAFPTHILGLQLYTVIGTNQS